jgi:glutamyl-tRNA synthetase
MVITRFAPSPTGLLHIGSVRTAIYCYLFAKKNKGKFLLRIEDTDKERSTQQAKDVILSGLKSVGLNWDDKEVYQSENEEIHRQAAYKLVENGHAYYDYSTKEELESMRDEAKEKNIAFIYRYNEEKSKPKTGIEPVIRLKVIPGRNVTINDIVKGDISFETDNIEDFVILRSDKTPTYMLAVVVDDINMDITHVIRGDDHVTNTPKQVLLYEALGAKVPEFGHIPLIHDSEGKKLSKRRGSVGVSEFLNDGFLPEALFNYLLKLGWSHGTQEYFSKDEMISLFDISKVSHAPARFDTDKLLNINLHYISQKSEEEIFDLIKDRLLIFKPSGIGEVEKKRLLSIMHIAKKYKTLNEVSQIVRPFLDIALEYSQESIALIKNSRVEIAKIQQMFIDKQQNVVDDFASVFKVFLEANGYKFKDIGPIIRSCLIGSTNSIPIGDIVKSLGYEECLARIQKTDLL